MISEEGLRLDKHEFRFGGLFCAEIKEYGFCLYCGRGEEDDNHKELDGSDFLDYLDLRVGPFPVGPIRR